MDQGSSYIKSNINILTQRGASASTLEHMITNVWHRALHQLMPPLTTSLWLCSAVKISPKPHKYLCPLIVKRQHEWMHNAPCRSYFRREMHSDCHDVSVTMTTEFSAPASQPGPGPHQFAQRKKKKVAGFLWKRGETMFRVWKALHEAEIWILMRICSYFNVSRTRVFDRAHFEKAALLMWKSGSGHYWTFSELLKEVVTSQQEPRQILWPYKDVRNYKLLHLHSTASLSQRPDSFIVLVLSDKSRW